MDQTEKEIKVLTIQEVSALLKIPTSTLYVLAKQGKLKGAKFGRQWRFLQQDILDHMQGGYTHAV